MRSPNLFVLYGRVRRAVNGVLLVFDDFWEILLESVVGKLCGGCCGSFDEKTI